MSPAIKSDGAESRSIRILSLIDGGSGPGDFDAPCNTVGERDDMPEQSLPVYESSSRRHEYQSLDQRLLSHDQQLRLPRDGPDAQKSESSQPVDKAILQTKINVSEIISLLHFLINRCL